MTTAQVIAQLEKESEQQRQAILRNPMNPDPVEILLVEDNPHDAELTLYALKKYNVANHIEVARDGAEALDYVFCTGAYAHRHIGDTPKIVLLDLKLPKVDGLEVLRRIKTDPQTRAVSVVVLTSSREERDIVESYQLGVNSYIVKPVDFEQFVEAVRQLGLYWVLLNQTRAAQRGANSLDSGFVTPSEARGLNPA